jgi:hypothetical protein
MLDFEQSSLDELVQPAYLVTIICEAILKDSVVGLLKNLKVQGYTVAEVAGEGRFLSFADASPDLSPDLSPDAKSDSTPVALQVEIRALVSKDLSQVILHTLKEPQQEFMIMAYRQTVEALASD